MKDFYLKLISILEEENKEKAVEFYVSVLSENKYTIVELYENLLIPAMYNIDCAEEREALSIWKEHVRSSIVRTLVELSYPRVIEERKKIEKKNKKVILFCPAEELHEIGARMVADYFTIAGYDTTFVGANTPKEDFIKAIEVIQPEIIALSITNYYHLVSSKHIISEIKQRINYDVKVIVGGQVFSHNPHALKEIQADVLLKTYEDIISLKLEEL